MSVSKCESEKKTNFLFYLLAFAILSLYALNPTIDSFRRYIRKQASYSGPFGCILSNLNVWYAQRTNSMRIHNFILFSLIHAPPYLMEVLDSSAVASSSKRCLFLGILGNWFPICFSPNLRIIPKIAQCNYKGLEIIPGRCFCLPSWKGDDCSRALFTFKPFDIAAFISALVSGIMLYKSI